MVTKFEDFGSTDHGHHRVVDHNPAQGFLSPAERLAVLETKFDQMKADHLEIITKLDDLLELKHKGLGAVWFVSLIIGATITAGIGTIVALFKNGHL